MASQRDPSTSVHPRVQAARMEGAARGEFLARATRDVDLMEAGAAPETLALIGGPSIRTPSQAWAVALWLWMEAEQEGLNGPATILYNVIAHNEYPAPPEGETFGWHFPARTRAGIALARQLLNAALHAASIEAPRPTAPKPHLESAALGEWWASMLEGAGLSEEAATLYQVRKADEVPKASSRDVAILRKHSRQSAASPDPELPEAPGKNRPRNASPGLLVSGATPPTGD
jgi:hypothetical protein